MRTLFPALVLIGLLSPAVPALSQEAPQDFEAAVLEAQKKFQEWARVTANFIADVTFDRADVDSFIAHYPGFAAVGEAKLEAGEEEEMIDYRTILEDPDFRAWAAAEGLSAEPWLKRSVRIMAMTMRDNMQQGLDEAASTLPQQKAMIEQQCAQVDPQTCRQMRQAVELSVLGLERTREAFASLPEASPEERALLEEFGEELAALMLDEGPDEEG